MSKFTKSKKMQKFKEEVIDNCKQLIDLQATRIHKRYIRSAEVMELLKISPGTLQNLRLNGTLPYSKIGGIILYDTKEIQKILKENRVQHKRKLKSKDP